MNWILTLATAALLVFTVPRFDLSWLAAVALAPLLILFRWAIGREEESYRNANKGYPFSRFHRFILPAALVLAALGLSEMQIGLLLSLTLAANYGIGAVSAKIYGMAPLLIPSVFVGMVIGNKVFPYIPQRWFQLLLNSIILYSACRILIEYI